MISTENVTLSYGKRKLFEDVSIRFTPGNCYGLIGANGSGKSTFLKILSGDIDPTHGTVTTSPGDRIAALRQDHFEFDELTVLHTVMMGHKKLYNIMTQKDAIYTKPDFNNEDGLKAAHLEAEFAELDGWMAESQAAKLLSDLGVKEYLHALKMKELSGGEKVAFVGKNRFGVTTFFQTLMGEEKPDSGKYEWGITTNIAYFPKENAQYFALEVNLIDWLRQFSKEKEETFIRSFLGKMLFSGEESQKNATVLSGGEKVRCLLAKMMLSEANVLVFDEPTNHLDLESISALNNGLIDFKGTVLFTSHDHLFIQTIANRIIEITPTGFIDRHMAYDEYLEDNRVKKLREEMVPSKVG